MLLGLQGGGAVTGWQNESVTDYNTNGQIMGEVYGSHRKLASPPASRYTALHQPSPVRRQSHSPRKTQHASKKASTMTNKILFLCTGNYYRSRFAEELFNHLAAEQGLPWVADSRGLAVELGVNNIGPMSSHTVARLGALAIAAAGGLRLPQQVSEADLTAATQIIALDRIEHTPYVAERLPAWRDKIVYWEVADLHAMGATKALARIEEAVYTLLDSCATEQ